MEKQIFDVQYVEKPTWTRGLKGDQRLLPLTTFFRYLSILIWNLIAIIFKLPVNTVTLQKETKSMPKGIDTINADGKMGDFLDAMSYQIYGRYRSLSLAGNGCVKCGGPAYDFKDELSRKEYQISCLCQKCQDNAFEPIVEPTVKA